MTLIFREQQQEKTAARKRNYKTGKEIHRELEFTDATVYTKPYRYEAPGVSIDVIVIGQPDKFDKGRIWELKCFWIPENQQLQEAIGKAQAIIYCWLTNAREYTVVLYDKRTGQTTEINGIYSERELKIILDMAISLKLQKEMQKNTIEEQTPTRLLT